MTRYHYARIAGALALTLAGCGGADVVSRPIGDPPTTPWSASIHVVAVPELVREWWTDRMEWAHRIIIQVTATNEGPRRLHGSATMGCIWYPRIYDNPAYEGSPVWRVEDTGGYACPDADDQVDLAPGGSFTRRAIGAWVPHALGGRPDGTYYLAVAMVLHEPTIRLEYPVGPVELTRTPQ
ncbi:MAG: hypothetical protein WD934_03310 [Gemmatimonadales bacterium]